jgi:hypothetical protein
MDITIYYVDYEKIRALVWFGLVWFGYFLCLSDYVKEVKCSILSPKAYNQIDCKLFWHKYLNFSVHKEPMIGETVRVDNKIKLDSMHPYLV